MTELEAQRIVELGRLVGAYGVKGWVKLISSTSPIDNIFNYPVWLVRRDGEWREYKVLSGRLQGKGLVARLEDVGDRDDALALKGAEIAIYRDQMPKPAEGEYYWTDLEGLSVQTLEGQDLGQIERLFETGSNDVLVVKGERERLIPFIKDQVIKQIDLQQKLIVVDWDPDF